MRRKAQIVKNVRMSPLTVMVPTANLDKIKMICILQKTNFKELVNKYFDRLIEVNLKGKTLEEIVYDNKE